MPSEREIELERSLLQAKASLIQCQRVVLNYQERDIQLRIAEMNPAHVEPHTEPSPEGIAP